MALVNVDISSYDAFRNATMGNGYDIDGFYGYQCWDYGALLWGNIGRYGHSGTQYAYPYLSTGGTGYAYGIWSARTVNASDNFDLIYNLSDVKRGDLVILDRGRFAGDDSGHDAFADEDYNGTTTMWLVGQNQTNPNPTTGHVVTRNQMSVAKFLGAFRFKQWAQPTPPTPTETKKKKGYPWAVLGNQVRNRMVGVDSHMI